MEISRINGLDFDTLMNVLSSPKITESQKTQFLLKNQSQITTIIETKITSSEFENLMQKRVIQKFRPLKNSFTKRGDKIILAKALEIEPSNVSAYIKNTTSIMQNVDEIDFLPPDKMDMLKTYVYRHGSKDELVAFLDYELQKAKDITKALYKTLEYYSGGVADYFIRPIHRMDNKTLIKIFQIINKNIKQSQSTGQLSDVRAKKLAKWALIRIYQIQNNSKLINAIKTYNVLK